MTLNGRDTAISSLTSDENILNEDRSVVIFILNFNCRGNLIKNFALI